MGGTFMYYPEKYRKRFITDIYGAVNDFSKIFFTSDEFDFDGFKEFFELPCDLNDKERTLRIHEKILNIKNSRERNLENEKSLEEVKLENERSKIRIIALVIETRSDYSGKIHINDMLSYGTTRVEVGVQSLYNNVLEKAKRGHTVEDSIKATQLLKDSFLKVSYHMMTGLPGTTREMDINMFKELFENENFKPDMLKIYPCLVMPGTSLYDQWKQGEYRPISSEEAAETIAEAKRFIPIYCRVQRIQRDIPGTAIASGPIRTNLRQDVNGLCKKKGILCQCIRCREPMNKIVDLDNVRLKRFDYKASNGDEVFLSFEDVKNNLLLAFCRLRKPFEPFEKEITPDSIGIREIHTYGSAVSLGKQPKEEIQHRGLGKKLIIEAEKIAIDDFDAKKMLVISGVGAREYFAKLGYKKDVSYMSKKL